MKVVVDENMPYAQTLFGQLAEVVAVKGRPLPSSILHDVDALMVRSVTPVNQLLLQNTPVKFVGTATAGIDHLRTDDLEKLGISFSAAPGCNALAVVEYVLSALLALAERDNFLLTERCIGIIGVGNVGRRLQQRCEALGMKVLLCDPPRQVQEGSADFCQLDQLLQAADIVTVHTPLITEGPWATYHLINRQRLCNLRPGTIMINACRGPVVDNQALLDIMQQRSDLSIILDVWEHEPNIDRQLLQQVDFGTAHIAGYTLEGKARGTAQVFEAWSAYIGSPRRVDLPQLLGEAAISEITLYGKLDQKQLKRLVHLVYDIRNDDALLRQNFNKPGGFDALRKEYQERREWSSLQVICDDEATCQMLNNIGFSARLHP